MRDLAQNGTYIVFVASAQGAWIGKLSLVAALAPSLELQNFNCPRVLSQHLCTRVPESAAVSPLSLNFKSSG